MHVMKRILSRAASSNKELLCGPGIASGCDLQYSFIRGIFGSASSLGQPQAAPSSASTSETPNKESGGSTEGRRNQHADSKSSQQGGDEKKQSRAESLFSSIASDVRATLSPVGNVRSYTRKYTGPLMESTGPYTGMSDLSIVKQKETAWQKAWSMFQEKVGAVPFLGKMKFNVKDSAAYQKGQQLVEDLKEKYETSDHPMVHKVEEYKERVLAGSEASRAMQEIRNRDQDFDMNVLLRSIKLDAPIVTSAFLKHDLETLSHHCGPEILQRLEGLLKVQQQQELKEDPTILFVGDVEVVEVRMMDSDPFVICQFHCQQLKCVRDKFGNVVEGSPDTIQRVYYFWGLQQEKQGVVTAEGEVLPPRWTIKDMLWQSMLALV